MNSVRDYAEGIKSASGSVLGLFEMFKDVPNPVSAITEYLNALPPAVINQFGTFFKTTTDIAAAVVPLGTVLEKYFPPVTTP